MGSIIPPGGIPPPATIPGPAPEGPVLDLPAYIPGGSTGALPDTTIAGVAVPPPTFTGPLEGISQGATNANGVLLHLFRWNPATNAWNMIEWFQEGWQFWPAGYYASQHQDADGNVDWGPHSSVFLVVQRRDADGNPAPYVIPDPVALDGTTPSDQCPPGMALSGYHDPYFDPTVLMCNYLGSPAPQVCPPGYHWDVATESCIADLVLPPPPPPILGNPPPPPPPPILSTPDPEGDDITNTLCAQMAMNAAAIVAAINSLSGAGNATDQAACCKAIVTAIGGISTSLNIIFNLLSSKGFIFAPVNNFAPAITIDVPPAPPPTVTIESDPNVKRIADDFDTLDDDTDLEGDAFVDYLVSTGALDSAYGDGIKGKQ